jgi:hypothetical protein
MKARTKFMRMFSKLPIQARKDLVFNAYGDNPMSLNVIYFEVHENTPLGKLCLSALGYNDAVVLEGAS